VDNKARSPQTQQEECRELAANLKKINFKAQVPIGEITYLTISVIGGASSFIMSANATL